MGQDGNRAAGRTPIVMPVDRRLRSVEGLRHSRSDRHRTTGPRPQDGISFRSSAMVKFTGAPANASLVRKSGIGHRRGSACGGSSPGPENADIRNIGNTGACLETVNQRRDAQPRLRAWNLGREPRPVGRDHCLHQVHDRSGERGAAPEGRHGSAVALTTGTIVVGAGRADHPAMRSIAGWRPCPLPGDVMEKP